MILGIYITVFYEDVLEDSFGDGIKKIFMILISIFIEETFPRFSLDVRCRFTKRGHNFE